MRKISLYLADLYVVVDKSLLSEMDKLVLNMLYMPLIGNIAISLYLKLQSETKGVSISPELTHHHLMTSMGLTLDNIKEARLKLEGIGLLKTYFHKDDINSYVYEVYSPVSPSEFFSHPIFNIVLYNNVGKSEYNRLYEFFKEPSVVLKDYEDISASFDSVFKSRNYTTLEYTGENIISKNKLLLTYELDYDFDLLVSSPPYGDNHTTVTYGQTSYLPLQWIDPVDLDCPYDYVKTTQEIDRQSLGGKTNSKEVDGKARKLFVKSLSFKNFYDTIPVEEKKKYNKTIIFIADFAESLNKIVNRMKPDAFYIWTIGNRFVGGREVPNDKILIDLMASEGIALFERAERHILNKKQARKNNYSKTMEKEHILIFHKSSVL